MGEGAVTGAPRAILRAEGAAALAASVWAYAELGASWWLFALLSLAPDLSMLAYLRGPRAGAAAYNAVHSYVGPAALGALGALAGAPALWALALVWSAHIGLDRMLGYGLKHSAGFGATHLGALGVKADEPASRSGRA